MLRVDFGLIFTILNLLVLYFALRRFLFGPVHNILEERQTKIEDDLKAAEEAKVKAQALEAQHSASMSGIEDEKARVLTEARHQASAEYERIVADAKARANGIVAEAVSEGQHKKNEMMKEARGEITDLIVAATARVVGAGSANDRALYDEFLEKAGSANDETRI